ncbi:unnamed protein product [Leptidea sinapis]|uniref:Uncharacterized protein n=1 Tax=Leptidea sinapis TaxID=189913 RepID=A0A5E4R8W5_9NEOP|nr:unnamed protein product [Leptidea sinapis]
MQQWQKVWTDKTLHKKNGAAVRRMHTGTGGGPLSASLVQWELRVLEIMGEGFGGPQTTACVSAFPTMNIEEEVAQYVLELDVMTQPEIPFSNESWDLIGTSDPLGGISRCASKMEISTENALFPETFVARPRSASTACIIPY